MLIFFVYGIGLGHSREIGGYAPWKGFSNQSEKSVAHGINLFVARKWTICSSCFFSLQGVRFVASQEAYCFLDSNNREQDNTKKLKQLALANKHISHVCCYPCETTFRKPTIFCSGILPFPSCPGFHLKKFDCIWQLFKLCNEVPQNSDTQRATSPVLRMTSSITPSPDWPANANLIKFKVIVIGEIMLYFYMRII